MPRASAAQWLTVPDVIARGGLWPFVIVQALLIWVWFALHAKRLRDAGRTIGLAVGVSLLYTLSVVLLLIVAAAFFTASASRSDGRERDERAWAHPAALDRHHLAGVAPLRSRLGSSSPS